MVFIERIEMTNETKTPQAGEWWINSSGKIRYIIGVKLCGSIVYEDSTGWSFANGRRDWSDWHHEPRCDSFDWVEQPAIDPGDGWELLPVGTMLQEGDEFESGGDWNKTCYPGTKSIQGWTYRRRKQTAEVWPKYYEALYQGHAYIKRLSEAKYIVVNTDGTEGMEFKWKSHIGDNRKQITEAEALARVKPIPNPLPALIPGIATDRMVDLFLSWRLPSDFQPDGGISFTSRPIHESWPTGTNLFTATQARGMIEHLLSVPEETSRVKPAEPIDQATKALHELAVDAGIEETRRPVAAERVPDHRPAREVIMDIVSWLDEKDGEIASPCMALETAQQWLDDNPEDPPPFAKPFTNSRSGTGIPKNNAPVELPDDWVDLPETHILRADIDQVLYEHDTINYWQEVCPSAGMRLNDSQYKRARCRRRDLPAPQPKRTPVRLFVSADVRWGDRYIVSVKDGNPNPERHQEVKFDGSRFYVEGIE